MRRPTPILLRAAAGTLLALAAPAAGQVVSPYTGQNAPVEVCFAAGTDPAYVEAMTNLVRLQNQVFGATDYHTGSRWPGTNGMPISLTWSFVPDGLLITSGGEPTSPSELFAKMDTAFAGQGGRAVWISRFQQVFNRWSEVTGVTYTRITFGGNDWDDGAAWGQAFQAGRRGDIRISMHSIDGPFGILGYNFFPTSGDMVLDSDDIAHYADPGGQNVEFRNTVAHEHGHGLGLSHTCSNNSHILMEPLQNTGYDGPQQDDIRGVQFFYGDRFENNNTAATATPIGVVTPGATVSFGTITLPPANTPVPGAALLSIDSTGKFDWFSFTVNNLPAAITVTPVGTTYDNSAQAGGCPGSPTNFNALAVANLSVQVYSNNGATLLGTASAAPAGSPDTLTLPILAAGTYHARVSSTNTHTQPQLYRLSLACPTPTITQQPTAQATEANATVTFQAAAGGAQIYRWRRNGLNLVEGGNISGSNTPTLRISPVKMGDAGNYSISATNGCGNTISTSVALTVSCAPNCDESTTPPILNVADFSCFLNRFAANDPWANCDGSSGFPTHNILDMICFINKFAAGCP
ncbi:MAG: matrixin family metalloprotease [Phycisphaerales bacterium]